MTDSIKKIYIDSRYRTSGTDSDFRINLPSTVQFEENTKMYITDIIFPNSIKSVNGNNNVLYINIFYDSTHWYRYVYLTHGIYNATSFTTELQTQMNIAVSDLEVTVAASYNSVNNLLEVTITDDRVAQPDTMHIQIYSDEDIVAGLTAFGVISPTKSANEIIGLRTSFYIMVGGPWYGYVDLHSIRAIYMTSGSLTSYDTIATFDMSGIIKKIPMRANYNEIIFDNIDSLFDYVTVGRKSLDSIDIQLRDTKGNIIDLQNSHISFTIVFSSF